ncbi:MAG: hypothetical protein RIQ52_665 [Pseudomonadota bacterium]|jgi:hypothetical protein
MMRLRIKSLTALGLAATVMTMGGCATAPSEPLITAEEIRSAKTREDHMKLAEAYETTAKDMEAKAAEHSKMLNKEIKQPYLYGRSVEDMEEQNQKLVEQYTQAAKFNRGMAQIHRDIASEVRN